VSSNIISTIRAKAKKSSSQIKKLASLQAVSLIIFYMASAILMPTKALAVADPTISGGGSSSGTAGYEVTPSTPIQVTGSGTVNVQINVVSGYLRMTTTTNLTFFTDPATPSKNLTFKGDVADVNNGLASLKYMNPTSGSYTITAYVLPENMFFNPVNGHYYKSVSGGDYDFNTALTGSAATTYLGVTGYLATVTSEQENNFLFENVNQENWIAASDTETEGTFKWVAGPEAGTAFWSGGAKGDGGAPIDGLYNNWNNGEPNDAGGVEDCGYIYQGDPTWNDNDCANLKGAYTIEYSSDPAMAVPSSTTAAMTIGPSAIPVTSCDDLKFFGEHQAEYKDKNMVQTQNIDCDEDFLNQMFNSDNPYNGTYDGQGFTIANFGIDDYYGSSLFGNLDGATIKNLSIDNAYIYGNTCMGGFAGYAKNSNFTNLNSYAKLELYNEGAGGIVGCLDTDSGTTNVTNNTYSSSEAAESGEIDGMGDSYNVGGIIGIFSTYGTATTNITDNTASHYQHDSYSDAGGIVGNFEASSDSTTNTNNNEVVNAEIDAYNSDTAGIIGYGENYDNSKANFNYNEVNNSYIYVDDGGYSGGIIGYYESYDNGVYSISNNTFASDSTLETYGNQVAGVIGYLEQGNQTTGSVNDNTVSGDLYTNYQSNIGGLIGQLDTYADPSVGTNFTANGNTIVSGVVGSYDIGGLIGYLQSYSNIEVNNNNILGEVVSTDFEAISIGGLIGESGFYTDWEADTTVNISGNDVSNDVYGGNYYLGGLLGYVQSSSYGTKLTTNINENSVSGYVGDSYSEVGGLIGEYDNYGYASTVNVVSNSVDGQLEAYGEDNGGLIGYYDTEYATSNISNNTTSNSIYSESGTGGGLIGYLGAYYESTNVLVNNNSTSGSVDVGGQTAGGLIGNLYSEYDGASVTVYQNIATGNVSNSFNDVQGGLIGYTYTQQATTNIEQNISNGLVHGGNLTGGLIAQLGAYADGSTETYVNVLNNYSTGNVDSDSSNSGGLIGGITTNIPAESWGQVAIQKNYATGAVTSVDSITGGLIGLIDKGETDEATLTLDANFSVGPVSGGSPQAGLVGYNPYPIISNNNYYDQDASGQTDCYTGETIDCTAVNTTEAPAPDYFKNNSVNAPLNTWNFTNVWGSAESLNTGLPCLQWENASCAPKGDADGDGVTNEVENAGPNSGDANNDGIKDFIQPRVSTLVDSVSGSYTLVQSSCGPNTEVSNSAESATKKDSAFDYPTGLTSFTTTCGVDGATANITLYIYGNYDPANYTVRKYNPSTGAYTTVTGATLTTVTIGGQSALKAQYSVTDGGEFDLDGVANGIIVDPVGAASAATIAPNTGFGRN